MRILGTADLHLGRSSAWMRGPEHVDRSAVGAWQRLVDRALTERADAVLIAGDVFDGLGAYYETRQQFRKGLERLRNAGTPVAAVAGNHDWEALPRFAAQFPGSGLTLLGLGGTWETRELVTRSGALTVLGWSFPAPTVLASALASCPRPTGTVVVGLMHGDLTPGSVYHPLATADLAARPEPWLLGHLHGYRRVGARAVYPSSPQALDFGPGEQGPHGFTWLDLDAGRALISDVIPHSTVRFDDISLEIDVEDEKDPMAAIEEAIEHYTRRCRRPEAVGTPDPHLASVQLRARVVLTGCASLPRAPETPQLTRDERDSWQLLDLRLRTARSPWDDAAGRDAAGEVARLLLGALCNEDGYWQDRTVDAEWARASDLVVERAAADVVSCYRASLGRFTDIGDGSRLEPSPEQARELARRQVVMELEDLLRGVELQRESAV